MLHCSANSVLVFFLQDPKPPFHFKFEWALPVKNKFFFSYQTKICVAAGEPHPQPRYQTASTDGLWPHR